MPVPVPELVPERNKNVSVRAKVCREATASGKTALKKMLPMRTYESSSKIDTLCTKSANNKIK